MMRPQWNFKGDIALPLEIYGQKYIGSTCYEADDIEIGQFVDAMLQILSVTYGDLSKVSDFVKQCNKYAGLSGSKIPPEVADSLFDDFKQLIADYEKGRMGQ